MGLFSFGKKKSDGYIIKEIKESGSGLITAITTSKKWGEDFRLVCRSEEQISYALGCLDYLDSMPLEVEKRLCKYLVRYYKDFEQFLDDEQKADMGTVNEGSVLKFIRIKSVIVDDHCRRDRVEFHIEGGCKWEVEHGLEITISDGKILYVGAFEDYGPNTSRLAYIIEKYGYYDPDKDMNTNYVDKDA
ncbi:DUF6985 domain-containing protein [Butyrivibrio sp. INlla14]|uniref:DUF6985 domain-containing protein n=1 Tax=Butyrivibrio sp. INlla14 TaxID=1520808 RepID=UPI0008773AD3|nr:hypothetical protein [Butyrivibrio sp. INlla14]SCY10446.1 hypothetical protein SAMN02910371_01076 [Butyrivibrio sp. INlla14]